METVYVVKPPSGPARVVVPFYLILLDVAGFGVIGLGFAVQLGRLRPFPLSWQPAWAGVLLMLLGLALMLPLLFYIMKAVKQARREEDAWLKTLPDDIQKKMLEKLKHEPRK